MMSRIPMVFLLIWLHFANQSPVFAEPRNQLQNSSFEEDWLIGSILAQRRFNILQRSEVGYAESDRVIDHWQTPTSNWDPAVAHGGNRSLKLDGGSVSQGVRYAVKAAQNRNPTGTGSNFEQFSAEDLAKLAPRIVRGGVWVKAAGAPEGGAVTIEQGDKKATAPIPGGTYDWKLVEVVSPEPWPAAAALRISVKGAGPSLWIDDAYLADEPRGGNALSSGGFEKLDAAGWPAGFGKPEPFWFHRYDYYGFTGWSHDGGYGCYTKQLINLVPGYRWRGHAAIDRLVRHSGDNSMRLVALPGDNFGVRGPAVKIDGGRPFEIGCWVKADRIHEIELSAINAATNEYLLDDSDQLTGLDVQAVEAGSKGVGTYDWFYVRRMFAPKEAVTQIQPMIAVRGFDGLVIEKNIVGTVWFDDLEVIQDGATASPGPAVAAGLQIAELDLGDRLWGKNTARLSFESTEATAIDLKLTIRSPQGKTQELTRKANIPAGRSQPIELPYTIDALCGNSAEQYAVKLEVTSKGGTQAIETAFGTPSSLLTTRQSHQYLLPGERLVVATTLEISRGSLQEVAKAVLEIVDTTGKVVASQAVDQPAGKLPPATPEAGVLKHLNQDRLITIAPDSNACQVHPWREAVRDYQVRVRLLDASGKQLAQANGAKFGRISAFDPPGLGIKAIGQAGPNKIWEMEGKVEVNEENFILVGGKAFFPVYFGEYGDTFRPEEGVNIDRDQISSLGINPRTLSVEEKKKYGMPDGFAAGEWDLANFNHLKPEQIQAMVDQVRRDQPQKLISSNYDLISHFGSAGWDVSKYFLPAWDIACMEASFASHVPNLRVDWFPAMKGKRSALLVGFENYYFVPFEELRYRSYLTVMRGAAGLGLIPSRMMEARPETNNYLRGLNAEFRSLAPVFASPSPAALTTVDDDRLYRWEKQHGGKRYLIVVRSEPLLTRGLFNWDEKRRTPSGRPAHTEPAADVLSQHLVQNLRPVRIDPGATIVQDVFVAAPVAPMIALQVRSHTDRDHTWEHRAYWGKADPKKYVEEATYPTDRKPAHPWHAWMVVESPRQPINAGMERGAGYYEILGGKACKAVDGSTSLHRMGDVPVAGEWQVLRIPAAAIGLEKQNIDGLCFSVDRGQVFWGATTIQQSNGAKSVVLDGPIEEMQSSPSPWKVKFTVPGNKAVKVRPLFETSVPSVEGDSFTDTLDQPYRARVYEISTP